MKSKLLISSLCFMSFLPMHLWADNATETKNVIQRFMGKNDLPIEIAYDQKAEEFPYYDVKLKDGKLVVTGSSGVAVCKGVYDFIKDQGLGISSWSGSRMISPTFLPANYHKKVVSPFKHHYYLNVVTYGYTMPYWDWSRWQKEIDWMALHGIDMPLALVAQEAIMARVFKKLGLSDEEISQYFVGPAHLPWMRMGNISGIDGPLDESWHAGQLALQHKVLKRMKDLGMKPICPGFAGFVPQSIKRLYPDAQIVETHWSGAFKNWMLMPHQDLFVDIGEMFIKEWEKEFGKNDYYLVDSFNEMEIPFPPKGTKERTDLLENYGKQVYASIKKGNPDATWVMQGWMFGYQRNIWDQASLSALVKHVPNQKMLLLDLAADYNKHFWNNGYNWDLHQGFYQKDWVYSVIPNMGGKTGHTGVLEFYANGHLDALKSANKGNLVGFGLAPEGIENNEVIYELLSDAGWSKQAIDLKQWLANYNMNRYGKNTPELQKYWQNMLASVYGSFTDHPRFNWQLRPGQSQRGSIRISDVYDQAIKDFLKASDDCKENPIYQADLMELTAMYVGSKLELLSQRIEEAFAQKDEAKAKALILQFKTMMLGMDRILASHPTLTLDHWLKQAQDLDQQTGGKHGYEKNARRIVTVWGPPVNDYSARIWSGLIRDYYWPRWDQYFQNKLGANHNIEAWELDWVTKQKGVSPIKPYADIVKASSDLINYADATLQSSSTMDAPMILARIDQKKLTVESNLSWNDLKKYRGVVVQVKKGQAQLTLKKALLLLDGKQLALNIPDPNLSAQKNSCEATWEIPHDATGNNECKLILEFVQKDATDFSAEVSLMPAS